MEGISCYYRRLLKRGAWPCTIMHSIVDMLENKPGTIIFGCLIGDVDREAEFTHGVIGTDKYISGISN